MNTNVLSAVIKRNLVSYFSSPLGYLFIGLFVWLSAAAAFFPPAFFNANLANLDQLNKWIVGIMLLFIPAITMSIWADELRQGTDELLLTMPATDFDIVIGKYLAAISIYTVALVIAMASNYLVLSRLGKPDVGLYLCTHFGYWLLGLAMLAVGMVGSFLTRNLTVAYILGLILNLPLAIMSQFDIAPGLSRKVADGVREWSFGGQCEEFGRGILSISGIVYFLAIVVIMLYVCVILLGRRHWARRDDGGVQAMHYTVRCVALVAIAAALVFILQNYDIRRDATSEQLTALSPITRSLVANLQEDYAKAREISPELSKLEEARDKYIEAQKKIADAKAAVEKAAQEKAAKEKADAEAAKAAAAAKTSAPQVNAVKAPETKTEPPKPAESKTTAAAPIARMAAESADDKSSAAPAKAAETVKADGKAKADEKAKAGEKPADEPNGEVEKKYASVPPLSAEDTKKLNKLKIDFDALKVHGPVRIDAYISPEVPDSYVQTRLNLLSVLHEFKRLGGEMVELNINEIERFDPLAEVAKNRYGIVPHETQAIRNGAIRKEKIFMGVAFTCGLDKVVLPFIDKGLPPEYELVRSLCTVTKQKRKRIGVLETDAHVMGNFSMQGMTPEWRLIQELKKQYDVVQVNPSELIAPPKPGEEKKFDAVLAIQPSAMGPREMGDFIEAIHRGVPTVIFEDPFPFWTNVPGTYAPRRPQQQNPMMGFGQENQEKGDIRALWRLLGIDFSNGGDSDEFNPMGGGSPTSGNEKVVFQHYNPYHKLGNTLPPEFLFIDQACGAKAPFNEEDPISSKLQNIVTLGTGFIEDTPDAVKRLVAKWHNSQYMQELNRQMTAVNSELDQLNDLIDKFNRRIEKSTGADDNRLIGDLRKLLADIKSRDDKAPTDKLTDIINKASFQPDKAFVDVLDALYDKLDDDWIDLKVEYLLVTGGGNGKKTIQPGSLDENTSLEKLIATLLGKGHNKAIADLVTDLKNRFPLQGDDESEESRAVMLTKADADKYSQEEQRFQQDAERIAHEASVLKASAPSRYNKEAADNCEKAVKLKSEAAKLKQAAARLTTEGIGLMGKATQDDIAFFKLRIIWTDQAATLKDEAAELLSKPGQNPVAAQMDKETAARKEQLSGFKEKLATIETVGDAIKYGKAVVDLQIPTRTFKPLIVTGPNGGTVPVKQMIEPAMMGGGGLSEERALYYEPSKGQSYVLAAHIQGTTSDRGDNKPINVVLVADVDAVHDTFFDLREKGPFAEQEVDFDFDNVTFVLNALDAAANDDRFLELRKRRPQHRTLARFEEQLRDSREKFNKASEEAREAHENELRATLQEEQAAEKRVQKKVRREHLDRTAEDQLRARELKNVKRKIDETKAENDRKYEAKLEKVDNDSQAQEMAMQISYKWWAIALPPIPLLLVAAVVFGYRRNMEREGVSSKRLR